MNQVLQYIEEHLEEPLNIKQLADIAGYSKYYFIRLFKAYTNETVMEYVCRRRLIKSCEDKVKETIEIYMPLARKINNQKLTDELNELALKNNV